MTPFRNPIQTKCCSSRHFSESKTTVPEEVAREYDDLPEMMTSSDFARKSNTIRSLLLTLSLSALLNSGDGMAVQTTTVNRSYAVRVGDSVTLECEFFADNDFNLFDFPVVWKKRQMDEEFQVNMMGNLVQPFLSTQRFRSTFKARLPKYNFGLTITNILSEDNGNYSCEINGPQNAILGLVTHHLFVSAQVDRLILTSKNDSDWEPLQQQQPYTLEMTEDAPQSLGCIVFGGYPSPEIEIFLGHRKLVRDFEWSQTSTLNGRKGLRTVYLTTARWNNHFVATSLDDGVYVRCVVKNAHLPTNTTIAKLSINFAPRLSCDNVTGVRGNRHKMCLRCEVRAKPPASAIYWIVDENGTTVHDGKTVDNIWTLSMQRTDGIIEVQLYSEDLSIDDGDRTYTLVAENSRGRGTKSVTFRQRPHAFSTDALKSKRMYESIIDPNDANNCRLHFDQRFYFLFAISISLLIL